MGSEEFQGLWLFWEVGTRLMRWVEVQQVWRSAGVTWVWKYMWSFEEPQLVCPNFPQNLQDGSNKRFSEWKRKNPTQAGSSDQQHHMHQSRKLQTFDLHLSPTSPLQFCLFHTWCLQSVEGWRLPDQPSSQTWAEPTGGQHTLTGGTRNQPKSRLGATAHVQLVKRMLHKSVDIRAVRRQTMDFYISPRVRTVSESSFRKWKSRISWKWNLPEVIPGNGCQ